jgi:hypothetical protein
VNPNGLQTGVQVNGVTPLDKGIYPVTITASVDGQITSASFNVIIKDPCARATFPPTPFPLTNMILIEDFDSTISQIMLLKTDIEIMYGTVCAWTASLVNPPPYMSLVNDTVIATEANTLPSDVGLHLITVNVVSTDYPLSV